MGRRLAAKLLTRDEARRIVGAGDADVRFIEVREEVRGLYYR